MCDYDFVRILIPGNTKPVLSYQKISAVGRTGSRLDYSIDNMV